MAVIIVIPGIALVGILGKAGLSDPDQAYPTLVTMLLPVGLRGLILCGLFASMMSSVDSIFNSLSTMWSIDIYKRYLRPGATNAQVVAAGKKTILATLVTGILFGSIFLYGKFQNPDFPLTHWFNELSYYVKNGFVVMICAAVFLVSPSKRLILWAMAGSIPLTVAIKLAAPSLPYLDRSAVVILLGIAIIAVPTILRNGWRRKGDKFLFVSDDKVGWGGVALFASLILCHILFH